MFQVDTQDSDTDSSKMCAAMRGVVLLFLLSVCTGDKVDARISEDILAKIITEMKKYGLPNGEYAMAVRLTQQQCENGQFNIGVEPQVVHAALKAGNIYNGDNIIAATPLKLLNPERYLHAEYRLLSYTNEKLGYPILHLTDKNKDCIIFFTKFSPCLESCMNETGSHSIIRDLERAFSNRDRKYMAFVFKEVWQPISGGAKKNPPSRSVENSFKTIDKMIPLYRCEKSKCYYCDEVNADPCMQGYSG